MVTKAGNAVRYSGVQDCLHVGHFKRPWEFTEEEEVG